MRAALKRVVDTTWRTLLTAVTWVLGRRGGFHFARAVLRNLPEKAVARLTWPTLDRLPYRESDRDLWEYARHRSGGVPVRIDPTDLGGRYFALCGVWEPPVSRAITRHPGRGLMVDVGANFGYYSTLWLNCSPENRVVAVEPSAAFVPIFGDNLGGCTNRARLFAGVVGEADREVRFAGEGMLGRVVPEGTSGGYPVPMVTLPRLLALEVPDLDPVIEVLKIDAEGYDLTILNANRELFVRGRIRMVLWERAGTAEESEFIAFLLGLGYQPVLDSYTLGYRHPEC